MSRRLKALQVVVASLILAASMASSGTVVSSQGTGDDAAPTVVSARHPLGCC